MTEFLTDKAKSGASTAADAVAASSASYNTAGNPQRQAFLRSASVPTLEKTAPKLNPRWLYAEGKAWAAFSPGDSRRIEEGNARWIEEEQEKKTGQEEQGENKKKPSTDENKTEQQDTKAKDQTGSKSDQYVPPMGDPTSPLPAWRVPVGQDKLYDVDLRSKRSAKMFPVFWKGAAVDVRRGEWFFESSRIAPCEAALSQELEQLYESIKPWTSAYADELKASASIGAEGEEKLMCRLDSLKGSYVIFSGSHLARIYQEGVSTRLTKTLLTAWSGEHGGGTVVVRGYDKMQQLMRARKGDNRRKRRSGAATSSAKGTPSKSRQSLDGAREAAHQKGTESPLPDGAARPAPPEGGSTPANAAAATSGTGASSTDLWTSLTSRLGSWNTGSVPSSTKAHEEIVAESFKEAQDRVQDLPPVPSNEEADTAANAAAEEDEEEEVAREREADAEEIELVIAWHGIGQRLAEDWKNLEFSLAVNSLKDLVRKKSQAAPPTAIGGEGFRALTKGKRLIFVPINWRATLNDFQPTKDQPDEHEHEDEHLDNRVEVDDLFGTSDSIPLARQVTKNLLLDIPMYLSHHRAEVLRRAVVETNRAYALFCQRHPGFRERGGRVSMICHSLGCAMACDVLSKQPTFVSSRDASVEDVLKSAHLSFDVRSLYLCGSPAALFFYLGSRQLIARRGRELARGENVPKDEALDRGIWGCLAVDRVWNVINTTDPLATHLNGCVDSRAKATAVNMDHVVQCVVATLPGANTAVVEAMTAVANGGGGIANAASTSAATASSFFGNWSSLGRSGPASNAGEASGRESTTPPADLEEAVSSKKNKGKSSEAGGAGNAAKSKAQQWAAKLAQSRTVPGKKKNDGAGETAGEGNEKQESGSHVEGNSRNSTDGSGQTTAANADEGKNRYPPPPIPPRPETSAQPAETQSDGDRAEDKATEGTSADAHEPPDDAVTEGQTVLPAAPDQDKDLSKSKEDEAFDRARRRFLALNPLGRIDYVLPKPANSLLMPAAMLEYVQMLRSHADYWHNETFADFIIATVHLREGDERWEKARGLLQGAKAETNSDGGAKDAK